MGEVKRTVGEGGEFEQRLSAEARFQLLGEKIAESYGFNSAPWLVTRSFGDPDVQETVIAALFRYVDGPDSPQRGDLISISVERFIAGPIRADGKFLDKKRSIISLEEIREIGDVTFAHTLITNLETSVDPLLMRGTEQQQPLQSATELLGPLTVAENVTMPGID